MRALGTKKRYHGLSKHPAYIACYVTYDKQSEKWKVRISFELKEQAEEFVRRIQSEKLV